MTNTKLLGAAFIALAATCGVAHAQQGSVGVSFQSTDAGGIDIDTTSLNGSVLLGENFQINGRYSDLEGEADGWGIDAFVFSRNDRYGYGAFAGYSTIDVFDADEWSIGGFGQLYSGNSTWTAQLGYSDTEGDVQVIHLDGEGRFFLTENLSVQANLGYGDLDSDFGGTDYWTGGIGAEWLIPGTAISINGGWQHLDVDGFEADSLGVGVRWNFGGGSLLERNRSGASLRRVTPTAVELEFVGGGYVPR